jgi:hypothetical protein
MKLMYTLTVVALLGILGISDARAVYDPYAGRWLSRDPIEEKGGLNLYDYVLNDPIRWNDPTGLDRALDDHIHETVYVETWSDDCCHRTGWVRIDFGPDTTSLYNAGLATATVASRSCPAAQLGFALMNYYGYVSITPSGPPPSGDKIVPSSCIDDKGLLAQAMNLHNHPPPYSPFLYNCRNFANQAMNARTKK